MTQSTESKQVKKNIGLHILKTVPVGYEAVWMMEQNLKSTCKNQKKPSRDSNLASKSNIMCWVTQKRYFLRHV